MADQPHIELGQNIKRVETDKDLDALVEDRPLIAFLKQILVLADTNVTMCTVSGCHEKIYLSTEDISSALYLKWVCLHHSINIGKSVFL